MKTTVPLGLSIIFFILIISHSTFGQSTLTGQNTTVEQDTNTLSDERIEDLIMTLESETARTKFIDNLRTLLEANKENQSNEDSDDSNLITDVLDLNETSDSLLNRFVTSLNKIGLTNSRIGESLKFIIAVVSVSALVVANVVVANGLNRKINKAREKYRLSSKRFQSLFSLQKLVGYAVGIYLLTYAAIEFFSFWPAVISNTFNPGTLLEYLFALSLIALVFMGIWELVNGLMEYGSYKNQHFSSARIQTLLPIIRNLLLFVLLLLSGLIVLSEIGIDIMPLLAGAGVLGIAVGFGAQELVKDFLTGFIIILEDLLQVGDVVRVGDRIGLVEKITIRKVQRRDLDGTVHTVPFSEISVVDNLTKEFSYYLMDIGVAYREDTDEVVKCLQQVDEDLRQDKDYADQILEPLQILGVDKFADSAVIIRARIKTQAHKKWYVGREFNRRMKFAFDKANIEIPFPHQTLYFGEDKNGDAPNANVRLINSTKSNTKGRTKKTDTNNDAHDKADVNSSVHGDSEYENGGKTSEAATTAY